MPTSALSYSLLSLAEHKDGICSTPTEQFLWENTSEGLLLHVKRILKDLNYKKLLFTVAKRNLLTLNQ